MELDLPFCNNFAPEKLPLLKIFDDVIAGELWFGPPPQSKFLATPMDVIQHTVQYPIRWSLGRNAK